MKRVSSCGLELFYFGLFCANSTHFCSLWLMLLLFSSSASVGLFRKGLLALPGKHSNHPHSPQKMRNSWDGSRAGGISAPHWTDMEENGSFGSTKQMHPAGSGTWGHRTSHFERLLEAQSSHNLSWNKSSTTASGSKSMVIWEENPLYLLINY